jgi:acetyl-CoA acetyltransferase
MSLLRDKYAIVGVGNTEYGKLPGRSSYSLNIEAIKNALDDAGLSVKDVDGVLCKYPSSNFENLYSAKIAQQLGIYPKLIATIDQAGASNISLITYAAMAIEAGMCEVVVCSYGDNPLTRTKSHYSKPRGEQGPFGLFGTPASYAMITQRHMYEYGTTSEQLGAIAVACRKHASLNPNAFFQKPMTIEDHQNSRMLADPLRLFDCCPITDGGAAVIVTSAERAKSLRRKPVYISGFGQSHISKEVPYRKNLHESGAKRSAEQAYKMAGLSPQDVDVAQIYDCYTITALMTLEEYGFCKKGEGGAFVENGRIEIGGELPVNTAGGLLSETGMPGMQLIVEGVRQLRGECGERQVNDANVCIVSNQGGIMQTHSTLLLRGEL